VSEKRATATSLVLRHVRRAREALDRLARNGTDGEDALSNPAVQGAALKIAAEELRKALAVFERTKWK
jgi:hypothetical protein